jgi:hypothetical protein
LDPEWATDGFHNVKEGVPADPDAPPEYYTGGSWLLINSTERVYQYSRNAGNFRTQQWGDKLESYTGSENPEHIGTTDGAGYNGHPTKDDHKAAHKVQDGDDLADKLSPSSKGLPRGNPEMISKTWASSITDYTGSDNWKIPSIEEGTWAKKRNSTDWVEVVTETSTYTSVTSTTVAGSIAETSHVGAQTSVSTVGTQADVTVVGALAEVSISGVALEVAVQGAKLRVEAIGQSIELFLGTKTAIDIAIIAERHIGEKKSEVWGQKLLRNAKKEEITLDDVNAAISRELTTVKYDIKSLRYMVNSTSVSLGGPPMPPPRPLTGFAGLLK